MRSRSRRGISAEEHEPKTPTTNDTHDQQQQHVESDHGDDHDGATGPPSKRRKLAESPAAATGATGTLSRPISPPWRRIVVEGPTSFVEGGRRKSSRTNAVPLELQPPAEKRRTRSNLQRPQVSRSRYGGASLGSTPLPVAGSIKAMGDVKRPSSSAGRPAVKQLAGKSPAKPSAPKRSPTKASGKLSNPGTPTRKQRSNVLADHAATRSSARKTQTRGPHHTRRSTRASDFAASRGKEKETDRAETNGHISGWSSPEPEEYDPNVKTPRLRFKVKMPKVPIQHPGHVLPSRRFPSFQEWLESDDLLSGEDARRMTEEDAKREARMRARILEASRPGGLLSRERCSVYVPEAQEEPDRQYAHQDHLVAQALHFRKLMNAERRTHVGSAKRLALAAAAEWKRRQPKTEEEITREQAEASLTRYKQLRRELQAKWDIVTAEVNRRRLAKWEEEQQHLGKQALNEMLEHSTQLLDARRAAPSSELPTEEESSGEDAEDSPASGSEDEDSSNMSTSESEPEGAEEGVGVDDDEGLTVEQLRRKYSVAKGASEKPEVGPDLEQDIGTEVDEAEPSGLDETETAALAMEHVDDTLLDASDESTDMDDDMGDSDHCDEDAEGASGDDEDDEDDDDDDADATDHGLLGFFSKKERQHGSPSAENVGELGAGDGDGDGDGDGNGNGNGNGERREEVDEVSLVPDAAVSVADGLPNGTAHEGHLPDPDQISGNPSSQASPGTNATTKASDIDSSSSIELHAESQHPSSTTTPQPSYQLKTPIPFLLRGTLREYQHYGLDWLAGLYSNGTNGILADEMGLGKTIQTIALLAHLACEHEVWGPHLIVVPTSVMLNWEMEFKKWCPGFKILTYYGTQEERKQKRKGWLDDNLWHVCITSYQLVLQDQQTFKRRNWHYMVLDEAHNIKNFRSQRWQTLLTFKTRARLLLTGTPLQNNLTELWSLLFFLMPSDSTENGIGGFADLKEFSDWFRRPVEQILEHGRDTMDDEAKTIVAKLHKVLRPYLLRRLKADVEKQMPGKYEHVVYCRLSKRQRYLYDGFMALGQTRETLASGNYLSIINCLMQLRKVCNHPDLFETRQIVTSFAMPKAAIADYEVKELLVRRRLLRCDPMEKANVGFLNMVPTASEATSHISARESSQINAIRPLQDLCKRQLARIDWRMEFDASTVQKALAHMENAARKSRLEELRHCVYLNALRSQNRPMYGSGLRELLTVPVGPRSLAQPPRRKAQLSDWVLNTSDSIGSMVPSLVERCQMTESTIQKFACLTPAVVATDMVPLTLSRKGISVVQKARETLTGDPFHEARVRLSIAFPDKRLLQYDCGKLQRLDKLLRDLQAGGHRALIFTQMTKVLDILEQFLNIHGHRYLRLDGATKVEQRQILTDRFNNDTRILAFILSSRSGGLGINLTGADTVIFYDLDWNPAMDKQCQDRCHRIGQTRDVHIYRFVSEYTIESNILRKANQKRMLDDVVIQEGEFTTDYFNKLSIRDMLGEDAAALDGDASASAAMDRVLGGGGGGRGAVKQVLEQVEDQEDYAAARVAEKEPVHADEADFEEKAAAGAVPVTPTIGTPGEMMPPPPPSAPAGSPVPASVEEVETSTTLEAAESGLVAPGAALPVDDAATAGAAEGDEDDVGHVDDFMLRHVEWELKDVPVGTHVDRSKTKNKSMKAHRVKRAQK
ncbi:MAG: swr1 complex component [Thelocarpon impressellum]|nr:MAG: swr1 complex component [Thelocarpon impressellum]